MRVERGSLLWRGQRGHEWEEGERKRENKK